MKVNKISYLDKILNKIENRHFRFEAHYEYPYPEPFDRYAGYKDSRKDIFHFIGDQDLILDIDVPKRIVSTDAPIGAHSEQEYKLSEEEFKIFMDALNSRMFTKEELDAESERYKAIKAAKDARKKPAKPMTPKPIAIEKNSAGRVSFKCPKCHNVFASCTSKSFLNYWTPPEKCICGQPLEPLDLSKIDI